MSWRTVMISSHCKLDYSMGYLVVRSVEKTSKVHLSEISVLIVETTACSVSVALMNELMKKKIKVIFPDEKHNPAFELTPYYGSHDTSIKIKSQISWDDYTKQAVWTKIVGEKIKNQAILLRNFGFEQFEMLEKYLSELEFNDVTNREGHAAKVYLNALFGKSFSRNDDNPFNAMLDFGYSILLSSFNREVVSSGYLTQLGLFHDNQFNQYNLSSDLMEPFRPYVDRIVYETVPKEFGKFEKILILDMLNREVCIDGRRNILLNAIKIYSKSVFSSIEQKDISLLSFTEFENEL